MPGDINIVPIASLLADPTRASMLQELSDGGTLAAGELARRARVNPSTASAHLTKLVEAGLLKVEKAGRQRYYQIAEPAIIHAIETLAALAPVRPINSLKDSQLAEAVRHARMCYNHLAGKLGVSLAQALVDKHIIIAMHEGYSISNNGLQWLEDFGIGVGTKKAAFTSSLIIPHHLDWSERQSHLAGEFGAALARRFFELDWIKSVPYSRAIRLTPAGQQALRDQFNLIYEI